MKTLVTEWTLWFQRIARYCSWAVRGMLLASAALLAGGAMAAGSSASSSAPGGIFDVSPPGFKRCAFAGATCSFSGTHSVIAQWCNSTDYCRYSAAITATNGVLCTAEALKIAAPADLPNLACFVSITEGVLTRWNGPASASTQSGNARAAAFAIDGKLDTRWEASNSTAGSWLRVNGAEPTYLSKIEVFEAGSKIRGYRIEYLQGSVWVPILEGNGVGPRLLIDMANRAPVLTTAVRVITTTTAVGQPSIAEIVVEGTVPAR
ncbi:discoidin domain-containing protein [Uliginosibacterium sp. H3]|uniref:Discoidin domain-containing protein n=1 Tax=Uliginosibacterium silvisoli TaxID=3114758 RepID=A0ABU6K7C0_9RHOO|nr:discoidin domain-containing protein [Uliginosibacterium sp. H3]